MTEKDILRIIDKHLPRAVVMGVIPYRTARSFNAMRVSLAADLIKLLEDKR